MKFLFVCLGNICRSPIAHGLLKHKADKLGLNWSVDSAGTSDWHAGELPNEKSIKVMKEHGIDITYQRSRLLTKYDLQDFDLIYVMDESNFANVVNLASSEDEIAKVKMIMNEVNDGKNVPVPDPWGLSQQHYEEVYAMLDLATDKIIERLAKLRP